MLLRNQRAFRFKLFKTKHFLERVGLIATYYPKPWERVLAIFDDLDLEFGMLRMLPKGGHGGHNGMRSLIKHFGGKQDFPRLRFGVRRPVGSMAPSAYVLQKFSLKERKLDAMLQRGVEGMRLLRKRRPPKNCEHLELAQKKPDIDDY